MIKVKTLIELLQHIPPEAEVNAYEGEDIGLSITFECHNWWITATNSSKEDDYTEGFD